MFSGININMTITIHGQLATLAEHDNTNRTNRYAGAKLKKEQTEFVAWQCKGKKKIEKPVVIAYHWYISSKHDLDNIRFAAKYINDGLVMAGVLHDDSQRYVKGFEGDYFIKVPKGQEKVVVELNELE